MFLIVLTTEGLPQQFWDGHNWVDLWSHAELYKTRAEADAMRDHILKLFGDEIGLRVEVRVIAGMEPSRLDTLLIRLKNALAVGLATLDEIEWGAEIEGKRHCPSCFTPAPNHAPDCKLARAKKTSREALKMLEGGEE